MSAGSKTEATEIDTWTSADRFVSVVIETIAPEPPAICVTFGDACETWDDLTAGQARELAQFLHGALLTAAQELEATGALAAS